MANNACGRTGRCCNGPNCVPGQKKCACENCQGGTWRGDGDCTVGACWTFPAGEPMKCQQLNPCACEHAGGEFGGPGTLCPDEPPPPEPPPPAPEPDPDPPPPPLVWCCYDGDCRQSENNCQFPYRLIGSGSDPRACSNCRAPRPNPPPPITPPLPPTPDPDPPDPPAPPPPPRVCDPVLEFPCGPNCCPSSGVQCCPGFRCVPNMLPCPTAGISSVCGVALWRAACDGQGGVRFELIADECQGCVPAYPYDIPTDVAEACGATVVRTCYQF